MKICDNCKNPFPVCIKINGKTRNLNSRRYCLDCSPFGRHRTRPIGFKSAVKKGYKSCARCNTDKPITEFYSRRNGTGVGAYCKPCVVDQVRERQQQLKKLAVEYKGGKCTHCGYNKCLSSLVFHHKQDGTKEFTIGNKSCRSFEKIKPELDKCDLVCSNCHGEIHSCSIR